MFISERASTLTQVRRALQTAVAAAEAQHPAILTARSNVSQCEAAISAAETRLTDAERAHRSANAAATKSKLAAVQAAATQAKDDLTGARSDLAACKTNLSSSQKALERALKKIDELMKVSASIKQMDSMTRRTVPVFGVLAKEIHEGALGWMLKAKTSNKAAMSAEASLQDAKEARAAAAETDEETAEASRQMAEANRSKPSKQKGDALEALKTARAETSAALATAESATKAAAVRWRNVLEQDLVLKSALALASLTPKLVGEMQAEDREYQAQNDREEQYRREQSERDADPCSCSETQRCHYCYDQQNRFAGGHDREKSWSD